MASEKCTLCGQKKGKRYCSIRGGKICSFCCGQQMTEACPSTCTFKTASLQYRRRKEESKHYVRFEDLNEHQKRILYFVSQLERRIGEKVTRDPYYEDQHIREAADRVIGQYKGGGSQSDDILLNRVGVVESVMKTVISTFILGEREFSHEMILEGMLVFQQFLATHAQKKSGPRAYIQYLAQMEEEARPQEEKSPLII
ncbi:MAG: hypothetical protein ACMUIA_05425 [bacterium]